MTKSELRFFLGKEGNLDDWHQHPNGGGWIHKAAKVAPTAFVGPDAMVYGEVLDQAGVYDRAIIGPKGSISGQAKIKEFAEVQGRVTGEAIVGGRAVIADKSIVRDRAMVTGYTFVGDEAVISDDAQVRDFARVALVAFTPEYGTPQEDKRDRFSVVVWPEGEGQPLHYDSTRHVPLMGGDFIRLNDSLDRLEPGLNLRDCFDRAISDSFNRDPFEKHAPGHVHTALAVINSAPILELSRARSITPAA